MYFNRLLITFTLLVLPFQGLTYQGPSQGLTFDEQQLQFMERYPNHFQWENIEASFSYHSDILYHQYKRSNQDNRHKEITRRFVKLLATIYLNPDEYTYIELPSLHFLRVRAIDDAPPQVSVYFSNGTGLFAPMERYTSESHSDHFYKNLTKHPQVIKIQSTSEQELAFFKAKMQSVDFTDYHTHHTLPLETVSTSQDNSLFSHQEKWFSLPARTQLNQTLNGPISVALRVKAHGNTDRWQQTLHLQWQLDKQQPQHKRYWLHPNVRSPIYIDGLETTVSNTKVLYFTIPHGEHQLLIRADKSLLMSLRSSQNNYLLPTLNTPTSINRDKSSPSEPNNNLALPVSTSVTTPFYRAAEAWPQTLQANSNRGLAVANYSQVPYNLWTHTASHSETEEIKRDMTVFRSLQAVSGDEHSIQYHHYFLEFLSNQTNMAVKSDSLNASRSLIKQSPQQVPRATFHTFPLKQNTTLHFSVPRTSYPSQARLLISRGAHPLTIRFRTNDGTLQTLQYLPESVNHQQIKGPVVERAFNAIPMMKNKSDIHRFLFSSINQSLLEVAYLELPIRANSDNISIEIEPSFDLEKANALTPAHNTIAVALQLQQSKAEGAVLINLSSNDTNEKDVLSHLSRYELLTQRLSSLNPLQPNSINSEDQQTLLGLSTLINLILQQDNNFKADFAAIDPFELTPLQVASANLSSIKQALAQALKEGDFTEANDQLKHLVGLAAYLGDAKLAQHYWLQQQNLLIEHGEYPLQSSLLKATVLYSRQPFLREFAVKHLIEKTHEFQVDTQLGLASHLFRQEPTTERLHFLSKALLKNSKPELAIQLALMAPRSTHDPLLLTEASLITGAEPLFLEYVKQLDTNEANYWKGHWALRAGDYSAAKALWRLNATQCTSRVQQSDQQSDQQTIQQSAHQSSQQAIQQLENLENAIQHYSRGHINAPTLLENIMAMNFSTNRSNIWMPIDTPIQAASSLLVTNKIKGVHFQLPKATREHPIQFSVAGPAWIRLRVNPLNSDTLWKSDSSRDWLILSDSINSENLDNGNNDHKEWVYPTTLSRQTSSLTLKDDKGGKQQLLKQHIFYHFVPAGQHHRTVKLKNNASLISVEYWVSPLSIPFSINNNWVSHLIGQKTMGDSHPDIQSSPEHQLSEENSCLSHSTLTSHNMSTPFNKATPNTPWSTDNKQIRQPQFVSPEHATTGNKLPKVITLVNQLWLIEKGTLNRKHTYSQLLNIQNRPNSRTQHYLYQRLHQGLAWKPVTNFMHSAGTKKVLLDDWIPTGESTRFSKPFIEYPKYYEQLQRGNQRTIRLSHLDTKQVRLKVRLNNLNFKKAEHQSFFYKLNDEPRSVHTIRQTDEDVIIHVTLGPGVHILRFGAIDSSPKHYLFAKLEQKENGSWIDLTYQQHLNFQVSTREEPIKLQVLGPTTLKMEEHKGKLNSHTLMPIKPGWQTITLTPTSKSNIGFFRLSTLTLAQQKKEAKRNWLTDHNERASHNDITQSLYGVGNVHDLAPIPIARDQLIFNLNDSYRLGVQEDGTWAAFWGMLSINATEEEKLVNQNQFSQLGLRYRYFDPLRHHYWQSDLLYRNTATGNTPLLGMKQWWVWEPFSNHWFLGAYGSFYGQQFNSDSDKTFESASYITFFWQTNHFFSRYWDHELRVELFGRWLTLHPNNAFINSVDPDIYTGYKYDHRNGLRFSESFSYQPWLDTRIDLSFGLTTNANQHIGNPDNIEAGISWNQLWGTIDTKLSLDLKHYLADDSRLKDINVPRIKLYITDRRWPFRQDGLALKAGWIYDFEEKTTSWQLEAEWHWQNARGFQDHRPHTTAFKRLRQRQHFEKTNHNTVTLSTHD